LFESLTYELTEIQKLKILKRKLKPSHRIGVALLNIKSIEELRVYCRRLNGLDLSLYGGQTEGNLNRNSPTQICELGTTDETKEVQKGKIKKKENKKATKAK
jgi:hypothetical protein